jgi:hypothetical protein
MSYAMSGSQVNTSRNILVSKCEPSKCLSTRLHKNSESTRTVDLSELQQGDMDRPSERL